MYEAEKLTLDRIEAFLQASEGIRFEGQTQAQVYAWIEQLLRRQQYAQQGRKARGLLRRYVAKMTGLSRAQSDSERSTHNGQYQVYRARRSQRCDCDRSVK